MHKCGDSLMSMLAQRQESESARLRTQQLPRVAEDTDSGATAMGGAAELTTAEPEPQTEFAFQELMAGAPKYMVYRMFSSALQLANNGNVRIVREEPREAAAAATAGKGGKGKGVQARRAGLAPVVLCVCRMLERPPFFSGSGGLPGMLREIAPYVPVKRGVTPLGECSSFFEKAGKHLGVLCSRLERLQG